MGVESFGQNPAVLAIDPRAALAEQLPVAAGMGPDLGLCGPWASGPDQTAMGQIPVVKPLVVANELSKFHPQ